MCSVHSSKSINFCHCPHDLWQYKCQLECSHHLKYPLLHIFTYLESVNFQVSIEMLSVHANLFSLFWVRFRRKQLWNVDLLVCRRVTWSTPEKSTCRGVREERLDTGRGETDIQIHWQLRWSPGLVCSCNNSSELSQREARDSDLSSSAMTGCWCMLFQKRSGTTSLLRRAVTGQRPSCVPFGKGALPPWSRDLSVYHGTLSCVLS